MTETDKLIDKLSATPSPPTQQDSGGYSQRDLRGDADGRPSARVSLGVADVHPLVRRFALALRRRQRGRGRAFPAHEVPAV